MKDFKKLTEEMIENIYEKKIKLQDVVPSLIDTFIIANCADFEDNLIQSLVDCESPIEQLFSLEMSAQQIENMYLFNPKVESIAIEKQCEVIAINNKKYRVDFLVQVRYKQGEERTLVNFVVECDGYDFHQKTKEQVIYDNERARDLQKAGFEIVRFSGTEIWHKPTKCVRELISIIVSKCPY